MSQRSAGSWTCCTRSNAFPDLYSRHLLKNSNWKSPYSLTLVHLNSSWLVCLEIERTLHDALHKRPIEQFKPVEQSRQKAQRAYCPSVYAVFKHLFPATFGTGPLQQVTLLEKKFVIVSMYWIWENWFQKIVLTYCEKWYFVTKIVMTDCEKNLF